MCSGSRFSKDIQVSPSPATFSRFPLGIQSIPFFWVYPYQLDMPGYPAGPRCSEPPTFAPIDVNEQHLLSVLPSDVQAPDRNSNEDLWYLTGWTHFRCFHPQSHQSLTRAHDRRWRLKTIYLLFLSQVSLLVWTTSKDHEPETKQVNKPKKEEKPKPV